jgi:UDP-N-acetylmuramoylalanine--D-glutamate ligase
VVLPPDHGHLVDALASTGAGRPSPVVAMADDVAGAVRTAAAVTPRGGVVLFSPAAPTPDGEGGFGARSRQFVAAAGLDPAGPGIDSGRRGGNGVAPDDGAVRSEERGGE